MRVAFATKEPRKTMFTILLYIMLPVAFVIHDAEEVILRKKCMPQVVKRVAEKFPKLLPVAKHLQEMSTSRFLAIVSEELLLILVVTIVFLTYGYPYLLYALFLGFGIHLVVHVVQAIALKCYIPGLVTTLLLLPYSIIGTIDLTLQYGAKLCLLLALLGFVAVVANLLLMHKIMKK